MRVTLPVTRGELELTLIIPETLTVTASVYGHVACFALDGKDVDALIHVLQAARSKMR